jgi:tetratricopeptide (TPR) repeat protein
VNVEEQKQKARALEQEDETQAALELYEKILAELEGTPQIWRELPLYVKAGDLSLKLNDSSNAISHYEKAANAYAAYGSSRSVIALCVKILRVNPGRTHVFLRLVRLMIERHHLGEARLVLIEYAERLKLPKAALVLERLADTPEEQMRPLLEMLLELGGRYEYARAQARDHVTDEEAEKGELEPHSQTSVGSGVTASQSDSDATLSLAAAEQMELESERGDEGGAEETEDGESSGVVDPDMQRESEYQSLESDQISPTAREVDDEIQWVEDRPQIPVATPRASRQVLFREAEKRKNQPTALWIGLGSVAVIVVLGLSLVLFNVIPVGGGGDSPNDGGQSVPAIMQSDSASMDGVNEGDSTLDAQSESAVEVAESVDDQANVTTEASPQQAVDQLQAQVDTRRTDSLRQQERAASSSDMGQTEEGGDTIVEQSLPEPPPSLGVMVQDFDIESNTELLEEGRVGYRVTQMLGTGEILTLFAVYYGEDISAAPGSEEMTLLPLAGDTTTATIRFNGYSVEARALVPASVLEALLGRLAEVPRSN